jgi:hypothetical protein
MSDVVLLIDYRFGLNPLRGPAPMVYVRTGEATRVTRGGVVQTIRPGTPRVTYTEAGA